MLVVKGRVETDFDLVISLRANNLNSLNKFFYLKLCDLTWVIHCYNSTLYFKCKIRFLA